MRKIALLVLSVYIAANIMAINRTDSVKVEALYQKVHALETKISESEKLVLELEVEKKINEKVNTSIYIIIGFLPLFIIILGFLGLKNNKSIKEYQKEVKEDAKKKIEEINTLSEQKIKNIHNDVVLEISKIISKSPDAVSDVINSQTKDISLKDKTSICLIHKAGCKKEARSIILQLTDFDIKNVIRKEFSGISMLSSIKENIIFIVDDIDQSICLEFDSNKYEINSKKLNFFYFGSGKNRFPELKNCNSNFANSRITIYQNLMDLIRYLDFQKKI